MTVVPSVLTIFIICPPLMPGSPWWGRHPWVLRSQCPGPFSRRPGSCWKALAGAVGALIMMAAVGVAVLAGIGLIAPWNVK